METRKIQQVGGGTFTVSIPRRWATEHDIEAGNTAYLYTHRDGSLVVRWNEKEHSDLATTEIELDDTGPEAAVRTLGAAYTAGFEQIHLRNSEGVTTPQRRAIETCTRSLTGFEITEESTQRVTVQWLLDASDVSIRQSTLQLKYITLSMYESALDFFAGESTESEHIVNRDDEADRIFRLITRHFNRALQDLAELDRLGITRPQLFEYYATARQFERIADHAVRIARCTQGTEYTISGELLTESRAIGGDARGVVEAAATVLLHGESTGMAHTVLDDCERVVEAARRLDSTVIEHAPEATYILTRVLDRIIRTARHGGNIAELALRESIRP